MTSLVLVLALLLSGCGAKSASKANANGVPSAAPPGEFDTNTCSIEGSVVDDEINPVMGAQVGILDVDPVVKMDSDADGKFSFSFLTPGSFNIAATKAGYESDLQRVACEANSKAAVLLNLVKIPDPQRGYAKIFNVERGRIACGVGYYSVSTGDRCKELGIDATGRSEIAFKPDPFPITGVVYEMQWVRTGSFGGDNLALTYPPTKAKPANIETTTDDTVRTGFIVAGKSPINLKLQAIDLKDPLYEYNQNGTMPFQVRASGTADPSNVDGASKLVVGQDFNLFVAVFYLGEPIPADFTMLES